LLDVTSPRLVVAQGRPHPLHHDLPQPLVGRVEAPGLHYVQGQVCGREGLGRLPQRLQDDPGDFPLERMVAWRERLRLDLGQVYVGPNSRMVASRLSRSITRDRRASWEASI